MSQKVKSIWTWICLAFCKLVKSRYILLAPRLPSIRHNLCCLKKENSFGLNYWILPRIITVSFSSFLKKLTDFSSKHTKNVKPYNEDVPCFVIENDDYIAAFKPSLSSNTLTNKNYSDALLALKFEEIMLYLRNKYGSTFEYSLHSLISKEISPFKNICKIFDCIHKYDHHISMRANDLLLPFKISSWD